MILTISGPSGVGKNTVVNELKTRLSWRETISCTTRPIREKEVDGIDYYYYITKNEFLEGIKSELLSDYSVNH